MRRYSSSLALILALIIGIQSTQAAKRPGTLRALRIEWPPESTQVNASQIQPVLRQDKRSGELQLFFTQVANGTRNVWQATPTEVATTSGVEGEENAGIDWKNIRWQAQPVTTLEAPLWASDALPVGHDTDTRLLWLTNRPPTSRETTLTDSKRAGYFVYGPNNSERARSVPSDRALPLPFGGQGYQLAVSPSGQRLAYVSDRSGMESIFVMPLDLSRRDAGQNLSISNSPRRVATLARRPVWLEDDTVLYISTRPGQTGIYRLDLATAEKAAPPTPQLVLSGAVRGTLESIAVSPDGRTIAVMANARDDNTPGKIYLLSSDGSGIRAVSGTEDAAHPFFAPDGSALFFDKPLPADDTNTNPADQRLLWMVPLVSVPPIAQLQGTRRSVDATDAVEIVGTAFSEEPGAIETRLEWGEGEQPEQWQPLANLHTPLHSGVLATWTPPAQTGQWTLRLTTTDGGGDQAQSIYTFSTPLPERAGAAVAAAVTSQPLTFTPVIPSTPLGGLPAPSPLSGTLEIPAELNSGPLPSALPVAPDTSTYTAAAPVEQEDTQQPLNQTQTPLYATTNSGGGPVPFLPLPSLPPPPGEDEEETAPSVSSEPDQFNTAPPARPSRPLSPGEIEPLSPSSLPPAAWPPTTTRPTTTPPATQALPSQATQSTPESSQSTSTTSYRARLTASGVPSTLKPGTSTPIQVALRNSGPNGWFSQSEKPVRLFYRWTDTSTGYRARWAYRWLPSNVAPGGSAQLNFPLAAPPRAGQFRLDIGLLPMSSRSYTPPPATARVDQWPGEFGTVTFNVSVR